MSEQTAIPIAVLTRQQDAVEAINSTLRNAGHAAHCRWIRELGDLAEVLTKEKPHLLVVFASDQTIEFGQAMNIRNQFAKHVPVLLASEHIDEASIAKAMEQGASDVVTLGNRQRLQLVASRELRAFRHERALNTTLNSARDYRDQLKAFMAGSANALAIVQEGIIVDSNPAWLKLFGHEQLDSLVGQPLMDSFDAEAHSALRGALIACLQGKWNSATQLRADGLLSDGSIAALELEFEPAEFEGEAAVRVLVPAHEEGDQQVIDAQLHDAIERDASTGMLQRRYFSQRLEQQLQQPLKAGVRQLLCVRVDKFAALGAELGPVAIEDLVGQLGAAVKEQLQDGDLAGRFGDETLMILAERGTGKDVEALAANIIRKIASQVFAAGDKSTSATCSIGIGLVDSRPAPIVGPITDALEAARGAENKGGSQFFAVDHTDEDTKQQANDALWVKLIKSALMENRFRLMQQPIASLMGEDKGMFDVLVRMVDEQNEEVLPSQFLPAAERNDLVKNIDRWVIAAAMAFCAGRPVKRLFVRLSRDSVKDRSLPQWLSNQLKVTRITPDRLALQISEQVATEQIIETTELSTVLRRMGFKFVVEHFGTGRDSAQLLTRIPVDYIKIDGTLMQGLAGDSKLQDRIKQLLDAAVARKISTIAERVEDANTMAVLWQLGVEFIQGYFVNEPEQVTMG